MNFALADVNPISRLYNDIISILDSIIIKYQVRAEAEETLETKSNASEYLNALSMRDTYYSYKYILEDFVAVGVKDLPTINAYVKNNQLVPPILQTKLLKLRRQQVIDNFVEKNNYYRMLNGFPDMEDEDWVYLTEEEYENYNIPLGMPIHLIADNLGNYYINILEADGVLDRLRSENPDKEYLDHLGTRRISIKDAREAKNFALLHVVQDDVMESTYREFIRSYEKARIYFTSVCYVYEYSNTIPYYDNFIGLCIFIMAIQQVSVRAISNAVDREFYDEYLVQLLYEVYGVPYFSRIDQNTQKLIVQNLNLLIQNKATNKVFLDIASILGFNTVNIYQYYLIKDRKFDENGRPIFKKVKKVSTTTGKEEEVYDLESMYSVHFQKVDIREENIKDALTDPLNRLEYSEVTWYDPLWWEDDDLHKEIWETKYNFVETKYIGLTVPYRMTDVFLQSVVLLRLIVEQGESLSNVTIQIPKIIDGDIPLVQVVVLFFALMAKKNHLTGQILSTPSKLIHVLEVNDQEINKENDYIEVLGFNFDAFSPENLEATISELKAELDNRDYVISNGHDVDIREDGSQDKSAPTHEIQWAINTEDMDYIMSLITELRIPTGAPADKVKALNKIYENIEALYYFLSYLMSKTTDMDEYYAIKKFYDTAFYVRETANQFSITDEDGVTKPAETYMEYLFYTNIDLYEFVQNIEEDQIYVQINHIIYKMEEMIDHVGNLYIINEGFSPLMELLQALIMFFKSYVLDLQPMVSLMVIDMEIDNCIRFFDKTENIKKIDFIEDHYGREFTDILVSFLCHCKVEDSISFLDVIRAHGKITISEYYALYEIVNEMKIRKVDLIEDDSIKYDTIKGIISEIKVKDNIGFTDYITKNNSGGINNNE